MSPGSHSIKLCYVRWAVAACFLCSRGFLHCRRSGGGGHCTHTAHRWCLCRAKLFFLLTPSALCYSKDVQRCMLTPFSYSGEQVPLTVGVSCQAASRCCAAIALKWSFKGDVAPALFVAVHTHRGRAAAAGRHLAAAAPLHAPFASSEMFLASFAPYRAQPLNAQQSEGIICHDHVRYLLAWKEKSSVIKSWPAGGYLPACLCQPGFPGGNPYPGIVVPGWM